MAGELQQLVLRFGGPSPRPANGAKVLFSETEKMAAAVNGGGEEAADWAQERCSELWNQIKDAAVLRGPELTDSLLANLQTKTDLLDRQIQRLVDGENCEACALENVHLRLSCVRSALEELKRRKARQEEEEDTDRTAVLNQFRRWLQCQQAEMTRIRRRIPQCRNSRASLRELEMDQKALQQQIQTEGRPKHQQLCSSSGDQQSQEDRRHSEALEQRYLALWLASLESLELINHFKAQLTEKCLNENFAGDTEQQEEGPDSKRRKTSDDREAVMAARMSGQQQQQLAVPSLPKLSLTALMGDASRPTAAGQRQFVLGSDIGYSSGENNSLHEGTTNTTKSVVEEGGGHCEENTPPPQQEDDGQQLWAEQIALSSELEKSFYRTVPLDEYGMTDLDTDEGGCQWPKGSFLAQKFMDEMERGGPGLELTDSLIVHVDAPESRQFNDFEEVMDLLEGPASRPAPFSEDDLESLSTTEDASRPFHQLQPAVGSSRKRSLLTQKTPTIGETNKAGEVSARKKRQNGRRKWAAIRKSRSSADGCWNGSSNCWSSDFEWDEDFGGMFSRTCRKNREEQQEEEMVELPDDIGGTETGPFLMARKKALSAFRESLRLSAADSGKVSVRLQELLALVDKSLGGVDSAALLLAELRSTFAALTQLCQSLESKMATIFGGGQQLMGGEEKENSSHNNDGHIKDIQSELVLCHERMNALETTSNNLALLLGTHMAGGTCPSADIKAAAGHDDNNDYLAQFAVECNRIREELQNLKARFGEKFVFCSIQLPEGIKAKEVNKMSADCSVQTSSCAQPSQQQKLANRENSFWRSYLLLCLLGFVASMGTLFYTNSRENTDWRWSFGPQLHYENGPPPF